MTRSCAFVILLVAMLQAAPAAAEGGRTCQYDLECGVAESCSDQGRCVARGSVGGGGTAEQDSDECGPDRRCRLDRLERRNKARRHARTLREEQQVKRLIEEQEKHRLDESPRLKNPFSAALRVSRLGPIGAHLGYVFAGRIQPAFEFTYSPNLYTYAPTTSSSLGISGDLEAWWFRAGVAYFLLDSWFSPYLSAGFQVGLGRFYNYNYDYSLGYDDFGSQTQARFHAGEIGGGFDLQFKFGLQTRLGVVYRPLIYNQARTGPGQYDPQTRQGLADWYKRGAAVDVIWLIGWAI